MSPVGFSVKIYEAEKQRVASHFPSFSELYPANYLEIVCACHPSGVLRCSPDFGRNRYYSYSLVWAVSAMSEARL